MTKKFMNFRKLKEFKKQKTLKILSNMTFNKKIVIIYLNNKNKKYQINMNK
jgi:hypothetical protein